MFVNRTLLGFAGTARFTLVMTVAAGLASSAAAIGVAFSLATTVAAVLTAHGTHTGISIGDVAVPLLSTAGFTLARVAFVWLRDQSATATALTVKRKVRHDLMRQVFRLGPGQRWEGGTGGVRTTLVDGVENLQAYVGFYLPQLIVTIVVPICLVGVVAAKDIGVALVIGVGMAAVPVAQRLWSALLGERANIHWDAFARYAAKLTDSVQGIVTLASLGAADRRARLLAAEAERLRKASNANLRASLGVSVVTNAAMSIGTAGATVLAAFHASRGELAVSDVVLVLFLAVECFRPLQELQNYWHEGFHGLSSVVGIDRIRHTEPVVTDTDGAMPPAIVGAPTITVDDVTYRYPGADRDAVQAISFQVPAGSTLAIVGRSGAGKSTLVQLLFRDLDPVRGTVSLNGSDLVEYPLATTRAIAARVSQDIVLLDGSIRHNILLARPHATDAEFTEAVTKSRVHEFARELPGGYDSPVGEGGSLLSGGQRQRVALARALIAATPILVLDEATSALDAENEAVITDAVNDGRAKRTTVIVAHRLSTIIGADHVLVLDAGRAVEFGTPGELATAGGPWSQLLTAHTSGLTEALTRS